MAQRQLCGLALADPKITRAATPWTGGEMGLILRAISRQGP